ncbi:MAG: oligopeptide/dipeptide ABC transporter ATP-binding protein, partial [Verrucomicrobiales bacterium]
LIRERKERQGAGVIFITHDLAVISQVCDEVNVMYAGRIVERASVDQLFRHPRHAYTRSLLKSIPAMHAKGEELYTIAGLPPDLTKPLPGCAFAPRNEIGDRSKCLTDHQPELTEIEPGHWVQNCPGCLA